MNVFSFIKKQVTILEVISSYTTLQKAGLYWKGRCPFHHEKTASFTVSPHKEIFYCFGCHAGGDVISFISKAEQCNSFEAANYLAQRFNVDIPEQYLTVDKQQSEQLVQEKKRYWQLCELVAQWCHQQFKINHDSKNYLNNRKINTKTLELFVIGYFPAGHSSIQSLIAYIKKSHFLVHDLLEANIVSQGKTTLFSPFEDRLIFPIKDSLGRYCGFGGRIFKPDDERPKYYNSKENAHFSKGSILFGFDQGRAIIQQTGAVFLVEGYFDCIAMVQGGYPNTVATLGTACTIEHLKLLSRYARKVFVLFDSDNAGQQAMLRLTELCWQVDLELQVISLPAGEDPASFLGKQNNLSGLIERAEDIFSYFISQSGNSFTEKSLGDKVQITRKLLTAVARISDPLKRDLLIQKSSNALALSVEVLKEEVKRILEKPDKKTELPGFTPENNLSDSFHDPLKEITELEKKLFSVIINNIHLLKAIEEGYLLEYLSIPLKNVLKKLKLVKKDENQTDFIQFFETLDIQEKQIISKLMLEFTEYQNEQNFEQLLVQFQKKHWKSFVKDIKLKLDKAQKEGNEQKIKKLISDFQDLKQRLLPKGLV